MKNMHGGDIYSYSENVIDFSANINPLGLPEKGKKAVIDSINAVSLYPDVLCRKLRNKIAEKEDVRPENIICGNGASELIYNIAAALKPKKILFTAPTFSEYEQAANVMGSENVFYNIKEENQFEVEFDILELIDNTVDFMFICNPNNPTGIMMKNGLMKNIVDKCYKCNVFLVIDECFINFADEYKLNSAVPMTNEYNNIFVLKAFTKMYAMAGLRLGYGICGNADVIEKMYLVRQPWNVSGIAQSVGCAVLGEKGFEERTREYIKKERKYIEREFERIGIKYYRSDVNFILFRAEKGLCDKMLEKGILIRSCENYRGLNEEYYRIAVKSHNDNVKIIKVLEEIGNGNCNN